MNTYQVVGSQKFGNCVDITDPCYDRDVWCRMNDVEVVEGVYTCAITKRENRVASCTIYLKEYPDRDEMQELGSVGVDAGLCGFFNHKKDYNDEEWSKFCKDIGFEKTEWIYDNGFFTVSGWGDGVYRVYGHLAPNGKYDALTIKFM